MKRFVHERWLLLILWLMPVMTRAGEATYYQHASGEDIEVGQLELQDPFLRRMQLYQINEYTHHKVLNRVVLKYTGTEKKAYTTPWTFEVVFNLFAWDEQGQLLPARYGERLQVNFEPQQVHDDVAVLAFENAHRMVVVIQEVNIPPDFAGVIPDDISLELQMELERYHQFSPAAPRITHVNYTAGDRSAMLFWDYKEGAEAYDLEWSFFGKEEESPIPTAPGDIPDHDFTRITISANSYELKLPYDDGWVYYRVRGVGKTGPAFSYRKEGPWSNPNQDNLEDRFQVTNHHPDKNWQYTVDFAEDGKTSEVLTFFDGSLRERQSVTSVNAQDAALITETKYDFEGRATIQTLPAPNSLRSNQLKFYSDFSLHQPNLLFDKAVFDKDDAACTIVSAPIYDGAGAGNYYSGTHPAQFINEGFNSNIPDASGYPYTQTQYDRNGRIKKQAGPGPNHKIGSDHETTFFYATPMQTKLDRLFGSEAGHASHYRLTAVKDANGQLSLSYENLSGQVVATSLVGGAPVGMDPLPENGGPGSIETDFNAFNKYSAADDAFVMNASFLAEVANIPYTFDFSLTPETYEALCASTTHKCVYDLVISIYDECDRPIYDSNQPDPYDDALNEVLHTPFVIDNSNYTSLPQPFTVYFPAVGVYRIEKRLSLHQNAVNEALQDFEAGLPGTCFDDLTTYENNFNNAIDLSDCDDCVDFCTNFPALCNAATDCEPTATTNNCEVLYDQLVEDMSPGGQYFDNLHINNNIPDNGWLEGGGGNYLHAWPSALYLHDPDNFGYWQIADFRDPNGDLIWNWDDLRMHWQPGWAEASFPVNGTPGYDNQIDGKGSLVEFHPEYCHYNWCERKKTSELFDANLGKVNTLAEAINDGYLSPNPNITPGSSCPVTPVGLPMLNLDPYFSGEGSSQYLTMRNFLADADADGQCADVTQNPSGWGTLPALWDLASFIAGQNGCTNCSDETWQVFKRLYIAKKTDLFETLKRATCYYICDNSQPPDQVGDPCGYLPFRTNGFKIRVPDYYQQLSDLIVPGDWMATVGNVQNWGAAIEPICDKEYVQNGTFNSTVFGEDAIREGDVIGWGAAVTGVKVTPDLAEGTGGDPNFAQMWAHLTHSPEGIVNTLQTKLDKGSRYTFSCEVAKYPFTDIVDAINVALSEGVGYNMNTGPTHVNTQQIVPPVPNPNGIGLNISSNNWQKVSVTFTADYDAEYLFLYPKVLHARPDPNYVQFVRIRNVSLIPSCESVPHCFCTELNLQYDTYLYDNGNLPDNPTNLSAFQTHIANAYNTLHGLSPAITPGDVNDWMDACEASDNRDPEGRQTVPPALLTCIEEPPACAQEAEVIANYYAQYFYNQAWQNALQDFERSYREQCFRTPAAGGNFTENFTVDYQDQEYQFTLYYYDQAGNLERTVPPEGVQLLDAAQLAAVKAHRSDEANPFVAANHGLVTAYAYNTLNEVVRQRIPDAEPAIGTGYTHQFFYDRVGRLVASQNAEQATAIDQPYSYTKFDALGRIIEVGEIRPGGPPTEAILNASDFPLSWSSTPRQEVTLTTYDASLTASVDEFFGSEGQQNLRSRVASVRYMEQSDDADYRSATHYSYDIHGNVKTLIRENKLFTDQPQRYDYKYDLVSGNVTAVHFQAGQPDQLYHRYCYDADNRLTRVLTSTDGAIWDQDARYFYYLHGPLARTELGDQKVQGQDYAYTLQGWLKGANTNVLDPTSDLGKDGLNNISFPQPYLASNPDIHDEVARDAFGFTLGYFQGDYNAIRLTANAFLSDIDLLSTPGSNLFNGNIRQMATALTQPNGSPMPMMATTYRYDQLNRLSSMNAWLSTTNYAGAANTPNAYGVDLAYDKNGNILTLNRNGAPADPVMDSLVYFYNWQYPNLKEGLLANRLYHVTDKVTSIYADDLEDQGNFDEAVPSSWNYAYDAIGNLVQDRYEEIAGIEWNTYGKIRDVIRYDQNSINPSSRPDLHFEYDAHGDRVMKTIKPRSGGVLSDNTDWTTTFYSRDAQGNVTATYDRSYAFLRTVAPVAAAGEVKIQNAGLLNINGVPALQLEIDGVAVHSGLIAWKGNDAGTAARLSQGINNYISNPDYTATVSGNTVTIFADPTAGPNANGLLIQNVYLGPGGPMRTVIKHMSGGAAGGDLYKESIRLNEQFLYGSSRLGIKKRDQLWQETEFFASIDPDTRAFENIDKVKTITHDFGCDFVTTDITGLIGLSGQNISLVNSDFQVSVDGVTIHRPVFWQGPTFTATVLVQAINGYSSTPNYTAEVDPANPSQVIIRPVGIGAFEGLLIAITGPQSSRYDIQVIHHLKATSGHVYCQHENARGSKHYELTNHLGNVLSTVSDRKIGVDDDGFGNTDGIVDYYVADVLTASDYYPFGMQMPERKHNSPDYRFGFNGKEMDNELQGNGNFYDYGFRTFNPMLGRFLSVDPLNASYPWYTPYQFAGNKPITAIDLDGLEELDHRILMAIEKNVSKFNINTDFAPSSFRGEKTRVSGGRKWNARWTFNEINKIDPTFWSDANKTKLLKGELPTVDEHYLKKIGKGLSGDDFAKLQKAAPIDEVIRHHHMKHGRFAVPLSQNIHTGKGNTKFWHSSAFRNSSKSLVKRGLKAFVLVGVVLAFYDLAQGNFAEAAGLPNPTEGLNEMALDFLERGIFENNFEHIDAAATISNDIQVQYWSADDMLDFMNTGTLPTTPIENIPSKVSNEQYPYMNIIINGESIGVINIPDKPNN